MSYADTARDQLHSQLKAAWGFIWKCGADIRERNKAAMDSTDVVQVIAATIDYIVAAEALREAADEAAKGARNVLQNVMNDIGSPNISSQFHTAYLSHKPAFVDITQRDLVPDQYLVQQPPKLDTSAIKKELEAGGEVPGTTLIRPNELRLSIRGKQS